MARVLYLDCFSGISGDMVLGAFLDAGMPLAELRRALGSLGTLDCEVDCERVLRAGVSATRFVVRGEESLAPSHGHTHGHSHSHSHSHGHDDGHGHDHSHAAHAHSTAPAAPSTSHRTADAAPRTAHHHAHRSLPEIFTLIDRSALSPAGRDRARVLFQRLAAAEAEIHQMPVEKVHLHEVGALDSIVDIVGAVFALEWANVEQVVCSPLNVGGGMVQSAHGLFPVPAPATLKLLGTSPVYSGPVQKELVTPTGALLATSYANAFGPIPAMTIERIGYGAGTRDNPETPNVLRILLGQTTAATTGDRVLVLECEIDDMNPQLFGTAMELLYAAGALEVFYVPVQMKKNRPGTLLTIVAPPALQERLTDIVFRETTTIGLRHYEVEREVLQRETISVDTQLGPVRFKVASRGGRVVNASPEFEDCAALARRSDRSVKEVQAMAVQAYGAREGARSQS